jgi:hypothetical protein
MQQLFKSFRKDIANIMIEYVVQLNYEKIIAELLEKVDDYEYRCKEEIHQPEFYADCL